MPARSQHVDKAAAHHLTTVRVSFAEADLSKSLLPP